MKKYDFILVYEHKVRELETLCLLKCELENRNYTVQLLGLNSFEFYKSHNAICKFKYHAKVLVVFGCYNTNTLRMCVQQIVKFDKVINLQWEQMLSKQEEQTGSEQDHVDIGKEVVHISWGIANKNRLINLSQIDEKKVFECGNVAFDFLTPEFNQYYQDKKGICELFNIPSSMKICTIFANFKFADFSDEYILNAGKERGEEWVQTQYIARRAKTIVLEWVKKAANDYKNIIFVYRPHPSEKIAEIRQILNGIENVRVIGDLSSKQWIKISDYIFTWHSTVAIEAKIANKTCILLEPEGCDVPELQEASIFHGAKGASNYKEFCSCLNGSVINDSISRQLIEDYFGKDDGRKKYLNVVDVFEKVYCDDYYLFKEEIDRYNVYELTADARNRTGIYWILDELVWKYFKICSMFGRLGDNERMKEYLFVLEREKRECASKKEIQAICSKIKKIIRTR